MNSGSLVERLNFVDLNAQQYSNKFRFSWLLFFLDKRIRLDFQFRHFKWILFASCLAGLTNVFYFLSSLLLILNIPHFEGHMGGSCFAWICLGFAIFQFCVFIGLYFMQRSKGHTIKRYWNHLFFLTYYPLILARFFAFIASYDSDFSRTFESLSFWCYIFIGQGFYFVVADVSFALASPAYIVGCIAFPAAVWGQGETIFILTGKFMMTATGAFCLALLYLLQYREMKTFILENLNNMLLERERQALATMHQEKLAKLEEEAKEKALIFGQLAHDIGTPLSALSMAIELLEEAAWDRALKNNTMMSEAEKKEQRDAFDGIHASISSIKVLRQSILDYVKKTNGVLLKPSYEEIDLTNLISRKAFLLLTQLLGKKTDITPQWDVDPRLQRTKVFSAENWLLDMLLNFISNAVKFTEKGHIKIIARLDTQAANEPKSRICPQAIDLSVSLGNASYSQNVMSGEVTNVSPLVFFEVVDTGRGIPKGKAKAIFAPFEQLQDDKGGTGLGLRAVKQKATALGGDAGCFNNEDGIGSTFFFYIPLQQAQSAASSLMATFEERSIISSRRSLNIMNSPISSGSRNSKRSNASAKLLSAVRLQQSKTAFAAFFNKHQVQPAASSSKAKYRERSIISPRGSLKMESPCSRSRKSWRRSSYNNSNRPNASPKSSSAVRSPLGKIASPTFFNKHQVEVPEYEAMNHKLTAIVVDDSTILLNLYSRLMEKAGAARVLTAENGKECLQQMFGVDSTKVDIVIMDDQMPGLRGPEVAKIIHQECRSRGLALPRIFLSTGSSQEMVEDDFPDVNSFVEGILQKPLNLACLKSIIDGSDMLNQSLVFPFHSQERDLEKLKLPSLVLPIGENELHSLVTARMESSRQEQGKNHGAMNPNTSSPRSIHSAQSKRAVPSCQSSGRSRRVVVDEGNKYKK